jgi:hypothetical protein
MRLPLILSTTLLTVTSAFAQTAEPNVSSSTVGSATIKNLLATGYEIKSSVPNGNRFIVFMQKDKTAYACEFVTVTRSRCESLN